MTVETWNMDMDRVKYFLSARTQYILEPLNILVEGISESLSNNVLCYPNPFVDEFRLKWPSDDGMMQEIAIYDVFGRKVFRQNVVAANGDEISINPHLPSGLYVLKVGSYMLRIVRL